MQFLKILICSALSILLLSFVMAAFLPSGYTTESSQTISADPVSCYLSLSSLNQWQQWYPWQEMDPDIMLKLNEPGDPKKSTLNWSGPLAGKGRICLLNTVPYSEVVLKIQLNEHYAPSVGFTVKPVQNGTLISWKMTLSGMKYPFGRIMAFFLRCTLKPEISNIPGYIEKHLKN